MVPTQIPEFWHISLYAVASFQIHNLPDLYGSIIKVLVYMEFAVVYNDNMVSVRAFDVTYEHTPFDVCMLIRHRDSSKMCSQQQLVWVYMYMYDRSTYTVSLLRGRTWKLYPIHAIEHAKFCSYHACTLIFLHQLQVQLNLSLRPPVLRDHPFSPPKVHFSLKCTCVKWPPVLTEDTFLVPWVVS